MQVIKRGFNIKSEVLDISSIKPADSGKLQDGREYSASVKFRSTNVTEDNFEDTFKEIEEIIEYQVPCSSAKQASQVTDILRKLRATNTPVYINTGVPRKYEGQQIYSAKSLDLGDKFLLLNGAKQKSTTQEQKAS